MSSPEKTRAEWEEQRLQSIFRAAGNRSEPPQPQRQEWEALFRREIGKVVAGRRQRRRIATGVAAAAVVAAIGVFLLMQPQSQPAVIVAEVMSATDGNRSYFEGRRVDPLMDGSTINVGQTVHTESAGSLALAYRGADVRLKGDTMVRFHTAHIELTAGAIYVDTNGHSPTALHVIIATGFGKFSHVGTQFMVAVEQDQAVTAAVREGTIMLRTNRVQQHFNADAKSAELVRISSSGGVESERIPRHGELWQWVTEAAPGRIINGLSAHEILGWIAREFGTELRYADDQAAHAAEEAITNAPNEPMKPARALSAVVDTTWLQVDATAADVLLVSKVGSEGDQNADRRDPR